MLYVVPTPLGNLEDITQRALRILREVRAVLCEDTRRTRILLSHFGISRPAVRYNERNPREIGSILERLQAGQDLALVCDSGSPTVSDPGRKLVSAARAAGLPVTSLPGACAVATALAGSGLPGDSFVFLGFLPRSRSRRLRAIESAAGLGKTVIFYESPRRVLDLIRLLKESLGPGRRAVLARELTKIHEEWLAGGLEDLEVRIAARGRLLGECILLVHPLAHPLVHPAVKTAGPDRPGEDIPICEP